MATSSASRVCLCLTSATLAAAAEALERQRGRIDLAELRADFLEPQELPHLGAFAASRLEPLILTVRLPRDGGKWRGTADERSALLARSLSSGAFGFVDLEEDFDPPAVRRSIGASTRVIRSVHDHRGVTADVAALVRRLGSRGEIAKLAAMPAGCGDLARLFAAALDPSVASAAPDRIVIGMGPYGLPTRVLAARLGSWLTYCSEQADGAAPGQITPAELVDRYRFRSVSAATEVLGVIGNPIGHSQSPSIHNAGLAALGLDAVYVPFLVDEVGAFLEVADMLGMRGVSVTVPHKLAVLRHLASRDRSVDLVGACNTLVRRPAGWHGTNTDVPGFLAPLEPYLEPRRSRPLRATVIGAGGAGRAVAWALRGAGAELLVLNRSPERAAPLAAELGCDAGPLGKEGARLAAEHRDLIVQTTVCGMEPNADCDPFPEYRFRGDEIVYELVYLPPVTRLLERAIAAGCRWIGGIEMLREQAFEQFRLFTGREYPRESCPSGSEVRAGPRRAGVPFPPPENG